MASRVSVPVIDMQKVEGVAEELVKAFEEWGCCRIANHGVPGELMAEMKSVTASLFDFPEESHSETTYSRHGMSYIKRGLINPFFKGLGINGVSSQADFSNRLDVSTHQREIIIIYKYVKAICDLAGVLCRKLMEGYGLAGDLFDGWNYELRMNKYHFCQESVGLFCSDLHSDPSFLTILQDDENVNGLQVVDKVSGELIMLDHIPDTLVVNIGDIGKIWSNGRYYNVIHRVRCLEPITRFSFAYFMLGPIDMKVEAPSELVDSDHPVVTFPLILRSTDRFERQGEQSPVVHLTCLASLLLINYVCYSYSTVGSCEC